MASYKEDRTFMASPVLEISGDDFAEASKLKPGDAVGPYRIRKPIGRGGMGEVYLAEHSTLSREVALKILPDIFSTTRSACSAFAKRRAPYSPSTIRT